MASCYVCGCSVPAGEGYRRQVKTGNSKGYIIGRSVSTSIRTHYGVRTLCHSCAEEMDKPEAELSMGCSIVVCIFVFCFSLWVFS